MFRASLALTLIASMIFAGCLEGGSGLETSSVPGSEPEPSSSEGPAPSSAPAPAPSPTSAPPAASDDNHAPVADLVVKKNQTALADESGVVKIDAEGPLEFDASGSSDADDDVLSFAWVVDGTLDPSLDDDKVTITLAPGTHVVAVRVSDGSEVSEEDVTVHVGPVDLPPAGGADSGGAINYSFEGDVGPDAMAPDTAQPSHSFMVPAGAHRVTVYMEWADYVEIPDVGEGCLVCLGQVGNLDLQILDAAGAEAGESAERTQFEYASLDAAAIAALAAGEWSISVVPTVVTAPVRYNIEIVVFLGAPVVTEYTGSLAASQMITNGAGEDLPVDGVAATYMVQVPAGTKGITARLEWAMQTPDGAPADNPAPGHIVSDLDLRAYVGEERVLSSANSFSHEFASMVSADGIPAGEWMFEIEPYTVSTADFVLIIEYA